MVCPICLRMLLSLGFIETMTLMLEVGVTPSVTGTNNVIPCTTETGGARASERSQSWKTASESLARGHFWFVLGDTRPSRKTHVSKGFRWHRTQRSGLHWGSYNLHGLLSHQAWRPLCSFHYCLFSPNARNSGHNHILPDSVQVFVPGNTLMSAPWKTLPTLASFWNSLDPRVGQGEKAVKNTLYEGI